MFRNRPEYGSQKRFEILTLPEEMHVGATRGGGDRLQTAFVEMRFYQGPRLILDEATPLIRGKGDEIAFRGANADGEYLEAILLGRLSCRC